MADFKEIMRLQPRSARLRPQNGGWVLRGDVVTYKPDKQLRLLFHSLRWFPPSARSPAKPCRCRIACSAGATASCSARATSYGFGLPGNEHTIPSVLAGRFGFPFANVGLPDSEQPQSLIHSCCLSFVQHASPPTCRGLFQRRRFLRAFASLSIADPVYGSPIIRQYSSNWRVEERGAPPRTPATQIQSPARLFTSLGHSIDRQDLCLPSEHSAGPRRRHARSSTNPRPSAVIASSVSLPRQDAIMRTQVLGSSRPITAFLRRRLRGQAQPRSPLSWRSQSAGLAPANGLTFVDEFHYDAAGNPLTCHRGRRCAGTAAQGDFGDAGAGDARNDDHSGLKGLGQLSEHHAPPPGGPPVRPQPPLGSSRRRHLFYGPNIRCDAFPTDAAVSATIAASRARL